MCEDNYKERYEKLREDYIKFNYKVEKTLGEFMRGICQEPDGCIYPLTGEEDGECLIDAFPKYIEDIQSNIVSVLNDIRCIEDFVSDDMDRSDISTIAIRCSLVSLYKRVEEIRKNLDLIKVYKKESNE